MKFSRTCIYSKKDLHLFMDSTDNPEFQQEAWQEEGVGLRMSWHAWGHVVTIPSQDLIKSQTSCSPRFRFEISTYNMMGMKTPSAFCQSSCITASTLEDTYSAVLDLCERPLRFLLMSL